MILRWLPKAAYGLVHEVTRHLLHRPVVGVAAVARTADGRTLLVRRADTGTWTIPGGTLEWGETMSVALGRELEEEAGVVSFEDVRVLGVWSRPDRDPRFHAVTVGVACRVEPPVKPPMNPLEIREARLFERDEVPAELAMGMHDVLAAAQRAGTTLE